MYPCSTPGNRYTTKHITKMKQDFACLISWSNSFSSLNFPLKHGREVGFENLDLNF
jgi:hypothetical protein